MMPLSSDDVVLSVYYLDQPRRVTEFAKQRAELVKFCEYVEHMQLHFSIDRELTARVCDSILFHGAAA